MKVTTDNNNNNNNNNSLHFRIHKGAGLTSQNTQNLHTIYNTFII